MSESEVLGMGDGQEGRLRAQCVESSFGAAVKLQLRRAAMTDDLHSAPQDVLRMPGAEGLHRCFLGRKSSRKVDRGHAPAVAVRHFAIGENAPEKPVAVLFDSVHDAADIGGVDARADDVRHL